MTSIDWVQNRTAQALYGVRVMVSFQDSDAMVTAALGLMHCHPHHFAVLPDHRFALAVSNDGAQCLMDAVGRVATTSSES